MAERKYFSLPAAARELGVSTDVLRRQYRSGLIPAIKTPGGQPRFTAETIETIKQDGWPQAAHSEKKIEGSQGPTPQLPQETASEDQFPDSLRAKREEVAHIRPETEHWQAEAELDPLEAEWQRELRQAEEAEAAQRRESARINQALNLRTMRTEEEAGPRRESEQRREQLGQFHRRWTDEACRLLPYWLTPEQRAEVLRQIESEIKGRTSEDESRMPMRCGEIVRLALFPFSRQRETSHARDAALTRVLAKLPFEATDSEKIRVRSLARKAMQQLGEEAEGDAFFVAAWDAIAPISAEIELRRRREKLRAWGLQKLPWGATEKEQREARGAINTVIEQMRGEQDEAEIHDKIEEALEHILAAIPRRVEEERRSQRIAGLLSSAKTHVGTYLQKLYREEELSSEDICDWEWRRELERIVDAELREELSGDETGEELRGWVEEILDEQLEGTDDDE
jgi:hypothetical protein